MAGLSMGEALELDALQRAYRDASTTPTAVINNLYPLLAQEEGMFITLASLESLLERCRQDPCHSILAPCAPFRTCTPVPLQMLDLPQRFL